MLNPLRSHIIFLENTIQGLRNRLTSPGLTVEEVEDIELQLSLSESALDHYRHAYALEFKLSGSEPPNQPTGSEPNTGDQGPEKPSTKKKEGLAAVESLICRRVSCPKRKPLVARSPLRLQQTPCALSKPLVGPMEAQRRRNLQEETNSQRRCRGF